MSRSSHEQCVPCHRGRDEEEGIAVVMGPQMPMGTEVASYETYTQACAGVDLLSGVGFDVSAITIVGSDLHLVGHVRGRLMIARASLSGTSSGDLWGALGGMPVSAGQSVGGTGAWVAGGVIVDALIGMALSAPSFITRGRSRDPVSSQQVIAQCYTVLTSANIDHAYQILQRTSGNHARVIRPYMEQACPQKNSVGFLPDGRPRFGMATRGGEVPGDRQTPEATSARTDVPVGAPDTSALMTNSPENTAPTHEDATTSSPEGDQTEA